MDTDQLIAFDRIVREGSFSRAAWVLGLSQPTISLRIQALERAVGGQLLNRSGRGVVLTDLGANFLPYARRALEVLDTGIDAARQVQLGQQGRVTIGVLESLSGSFLGPTLTDFYAHHPQVEILTRAGRHEQLVELLLDGVVSMALIAWPCADTLTTELDVLCHVRESVVLVAARTHPLATLRQPLEREQVLQLAQPFLTLRWWLTLPTAIAHLAQQSTPLVDVTMDTARHMVLQGVGAGFFPWMQVAEYVATGQLQILTIRGFPPIVRDSALVRRANAAMLGSAALALVQMVRERVQQLGLIRHEE
jgi:DNA-binding transcriptional LysR family regulator